ncbi:MAG: hypothetical protein QOE61_1844 [Micromonosporaceae bacterium]|nr:hypothetical protein [Micromonosporaceae bacterium]
MDERVEHILQEALRRSEERGVSRPRITDLSDTDRDHLAQTTLDFLGERPHSVSPYPGWRQIRSFDAGVLRWWNDHLGGPFPSATTRRLQTLREDIYDFLDDVLGRIVKEPGQNSPVHLAPPNESPDDGAADLEHRSIQVTSRGAGFGDAETNRLVETAAMGAVIDRYSDWQHEDVSAAKCGWDITFRRNGTEQHVEVKGVSGQRPRVLLTRNEVAVAARDPMWKLLVVTRALVAPSLHEFDRGRVLEEATPYVYVADMG